MHRKRNLLLALGLVIVLAVAAWLVLRPAPEETVAEETTADQTIYQLDSTALTGMSWTWGETSLAVAKEEGSWQCTSTPEATLDQLTLSDLATLASSLSYTNALDETADPAEFGFDSPRLVLRLYLGEATAELTLGMRNDYTGGDYLRYQDRIYLIGPELYDGFAVALQDLVPQDTLPTISASNLTRVTLQAGADTRTLIHYDDGDSPSDFYDWFDEETGQPLNTSSVSTALSALTALSFADCVAWRPTDLSAYGLEAPVLTVSFAYETTNDDGTTTAGEMTLHFGSQTEPSAPLVAETEDLEALEELDEEAPETYVYVQVAGSDLVYTAVSSAPERLTAALSDYLGPKAVTQVDWSTLRALRLTAGETTVRLGVDRVEETDSEGNTQTTTTYTVDSRESSYEEVYQVFQQLRSMETSVLAADQTPDGEPVLSVEFHRDSDRNTVVVVNFYAYDNSFYLVEADGATRLIVSRRDVQSLLDELTALAAGETLTGTDQ